MLYERGVRGQMEIKSMASCPNLRVLEPLLCWAGHLNSFVLYHPHHQKSTHPMGYYENATKSYLCKAHNLYSVDGNHGDPSFLVLSSASPEGTYPVRASSPHWLLSLRSPKSRSREIAQHPPVLWVQTGDPS